MQDEKKKTIGSPSVKVEAKSESKEMKASTSVSSLVAGPEVKKSEEEGKVIFPQWSWSFIG